MNLAITIIRMSARPQRRIWQGCGVTRPLLVGFITLAGSLWGFPPDFRRHCEAIEDPELLLLVNKRQHLDSTYIPLDLGDLWEHASVNT